MLYLHCCTRSGALILYVKVKPLVFNLTGKSLGTPHGTCRVFGNKTKVIRFQIISDLIASFKILVNLGAIQRDQK